MDRAYDVPARHEMESCLEEFVERASLQIRYGCRWEATRRDDDGLVLATSDGEYRCRAAVFALGVTEPWNGGIRGAEHASHYVDTGNPPDYQGKRVVIIGKRNSGFEVANGLLPWAREIVLVSPRPVRLDVLARSPLRVRYLQPYEEFVRGGSGALVVDAAVDRDRAGRRRLPRAARTGRRGRASSGSTPTRRSWRPASRRRCATFPSSASRPPRAAASRPRRPSGRASRSPGMHFAGNATQGAPGPAEAGAGEQLELGERPPLQRARSREAPGREARLRPPAAALQREALVPYLLAELAHAPELWIQKGYLARVVTLGAGAVRDDGILPLEHFVDAVGEDSVAVAVEMNSSGTIYPALYLRRGGKLSEHQLDPHPTYAFDSQAHRAALETLLRPLLG